MKMLLAYIRKIKLLKGNNFSIAKGKEMNIDQFSFAPSKLSYVISKPCVMSSSVLIHLKQNSILQIIQYICPYPSICYSTKNKLNPWSAGNSSVMRLRFA